MSGRLVHVRTLGTKYSIHPINIYEIFFPFALRQYCLIACSVEFMMEPGPRYAKNYGPYYVLLPFSGLPTRLLNPNPTHKTILISCSDLQHYVKLHFHPRPTETSCV